MPNNRHARNETSPRTIETAVTRNIYVYSAKTLLSSYLSGIGLTAIILGFGVYALITNGVVHNSNFSGIILATRNADLDDLARGWCLATEPLDPALGEVKMQFGVLQTSGSGGSGDHAVEEGGVGMLESAKTEMEARHAAFGSEGTVTKITRGMSLS